MQPLKNLIFGLVFSIGWLAQAERLPKPTQVSVAITNAYIPAGFDSNDRAELVVEGYFPNSCYRIGPIENYLNLEKKELLIHQMAYKYQGHCMMMIVPFTQTVSIGILNAKTYNVKDGATGSTLGELPVVSAITSEPDNETYASIQDAFLTEQDGKKKIILQGQLPGNCWRVKEVKVFEDGKNVIVVLPIIGQNKDAKCHDSQIPFTSTADLPNVGEGRFLLHVRSQNGVAVNKLINL